MPALTAWHFSLARQPSHVRPTNSKLFPSGSGTRCAARLLLLLLDELALDKDIDLFTDDPLAIEHHIERQAKVLAVDLALGTVADAVAHHIRVIEFPMLHYLKCNWPGIALA